MDAFKTLCNNHLYSEQSGTFCRPIAARPRPPFVPGYDDQRNSALLITHRSPSNSKPIRPWIVLRHSSFDARYHQILDPNISKGPAGHDQVISAPAAIAVEVDRLYTTADQVLASGRTLFYRSGRRDMVGRYRIAKDSQGPR